ncbi:MAG: hypothetical protein CVU18_08690 [Betaproteobacteria bacterium HGW-Betaproteobacteria-12]|nr:MAG: hypothetical protein CVU18_08690 [Betaproteobacteria bacterium HGW-Betaproteobacteria-12]
MADAFLTPPVALLLIVALAGALLLASFVAIRQTRRLRHCRQQLAAEAARLAEQQRFRIAFHASPLAASITRADDGLVIDANDNCQRDFGWRREELIGHTALELGLWPDIDARVQFVAELQASGSVVAHEARWCDRSGQAHAVELSAALIDIDGSPHILAFATDISERRQAQAELARYRRRLESMVEERTRELAQARDEAQHASRAKSTFLANMSHEIRTPLNAVIGLTHMIRRDAREPRQQERLDRVSDAARHLLGLINDILDSAKIDAERLRLQECDFASRRLFGEALETIEQRAREKGLAVHAEIDPDLPPWLHGDPLRLQQILINFLSNAVKFTERGRIVLRARFVECPPTDILLRCEVEDSGIGIPADIQRRLFTPFEQADSSSTRRHGGSGLGLAISRELARLMGGDADVDSQPGRGSIFQVTVRLGLAAPAAGDDAPPLAEGNLNCAARLLLVEDDALNREVALDQLASHGLSADVAENGQIAVEMAQKTAYDLILMDMQMPVMDGLEATRRILALPGRPPPIIAMTANAFADSRDACLAAGMVEHLSKPVDPQLLLRSLLRWLPADPAAETETTNEAAMPAPAAGPAGQRLVAALASTPGFDIQRGLAAIGGQADKYAILLRKYLEVHGGTVAATCAALAADDQPLARRLAHTLKGTAATLGLNATRDAAAKLEEALIADDDDGEDSDTLCQQLDSVHTQQLARLRRLLDELLPAAKAADQQ